MRIRTLGEQDIDSCLALSTQAAWNQAANDWRRLLWLWPGQCLGVEIDGRIVASGTLATYPAEEGLVGWVGMILVEEAHRGRGLGTAITQAVVEMADRLGVRSLGLDASEQGEPIYAGIGFVASAPIHRWSGRAVIHDRRSWKRDEAQWRRLAAWDKEACGLDREALLRDIGADSEIIMGTVEAGETIRGYGLLRPGRTAWHAGPVMAVDAAGADQVLDGLIGAKEESPRERVILDVIEGSVLEAVLRSRGFRVARRLMRMARPASRWPLISGPRVHAAAGFEVG